MSEQPQNGTDEDVFGIGESFQVKPLNLDALDRQRESEPRQAHCQ